MFGRSIEYSTVARFIGFGLYSCILEVSLSPSWPRQEALRSVFIVEGSVAEASAVRSKRPTACVVAEKE